MKVEIVKDENGEHIGWTMEGETKDEMYAVNSIRNMNFLGLDDTAIKYNGRTGGDDEFAGKLSWIMKKHASQYKRSQKEDAGL